MLVLLALPLALAACSSDPVPVDSGPADTGMVDTGPLDVGPALHARPEHHLLVRRARDVDLRLPPSGLAPAVCPCVDVDAFWMRLRIGRRRWMRVMPSQSPMRPRWMRSMRGS